MEIKSKVLKNALEQSKTMNAAQNLPTSEVRANRSLIGSKSYGGFVSVDAYSDGKVHCSIDDEKGRRVGWEYDKRTSLGQLEEWRKIYQSKVDDINKAIAYIRGL